MNVATSIYEDGTYLERNPTWHAEDSPTKARWVADIITRNRLSPQTIAEIGCGAGEVLRQLQNRFPAAQFSGFEISPDAHAASLSRKGEGLDFHLEDLTLSDRSFDLLLALDVFEHVPDYMGFIERLKPRAEYKLFHIPLELSVSAVVRPKALPLARAKLGHIHHFSKETALATLEDCGLEVIDWNYTNGTQELPNRRLKTRVANLPRKAVQSVSKDLSARLFGGYSLMALTR